MILWTGQDFFFKFLSLHNCGKCSDLQSSDKQKLIVVDLLPSLPPPPPGMI